MTSVKGYILSTIALLSFSASILFAQDHQVSKENYSLLWKIEGNSIQKPSYLFGTMHVRSKRAFEFSDSVLIALLKADIAAFELNLDSVTVYQFKKSIEKAENSVLYREIFTDEELIKIGEKTKDYGFGTGKLKNKNFLELKDLIDDLEKNKENKMPVFLDAYLSLLAKNNGISIYGLEDYAYQQKLFDSLSIEVKKKIIISKTDSLSIYLDNKEELLSIYQGGDINKIFNYENNYESLYLNEIIDKRNVTMINGLEPLLKNNAVFTAVGAAHLPGENGIIQLLRNKGYKVTPVKATFNGVADSIMHIKKETQWSTYCDSASGFSLEINSIPVSYKAFGGMIDMKVTFDRMENSSLYFYSIPATLTNINTDSKKFLDIIFKRFSENSKISITSKKNITYKGIKGIEVKMQINMFIKGRLRLFLVNNHVYFLMAGCDDKDCNSTEADRFFNSLTFFEPNKTKNISTQEWKETKNNKGAFSLRFPIEPFYLNKKIPNPIDTASEPVELNLYTCLNPKTQEVYLLRWNDLPNGFYYDNDSSVFQEIFASLLGADYVFDPATCKTHVINGAIGYEPYDTIREENLQLLFRTYLRGNRIYLLLSQSKPNTQNSEAESFFNSFRLIPYTPSDYSLQKVEELSIKLPGIPKINNTTDANSLPSEIPEQTYTCKDQNNGSLFIILVKTFPKYYRIEHIDSFYVSLENDLIDYDKKTIDTTTGYTPSHLYYRTGTIVSNATNNKKKYWLFNRANKSFEILSIVNDESMQNLSMLDIINSIKIDEIKADFDMYSSKSAIILNDIKSNDSLTFQEAKQALDYYKFDQSDCKKLYNALFYNYSDSLSDYSTVKSSLLSIIEKIHDEEATDVLVKLYKEDAKNRASVLDVLCNIAPDSKELIFSLLMDYKPEEVYYFQANNIFKILSDSISFFKTNIMNMVTITHDMTSMQRGLIDVLVTKWDTLQLHEEDKNKISNNIIQWYNQNVDSISKYPSDSMQFYNFTDILSSGIRFFRKLNLPAFDYLVNKLNKSAYLEFQSEIIQYNIMRKLPIKSSAWEKVLLDDYYGWNLIAELNESGNFSQIPKNYQNEQKLNLLALKSYFYDAEIVVSKIKLLNTRKVKQGDKELNYYIYEFFDESEDNYIAIAGGIVINGNTLNTDNQFTNYSYTPVKNSEDVQKETAILLESIQNSENESN